MRSRSLEIMTIEPRIPAMPENGARSGFDRPGRHGECIKRESAARCSTGRMNGELQPTENRVRGRHRHLVRTCCVSDDSFGLTLKKIHKVTAGGSAFSFSSFLCSSSVIECCYRTLSRFPGYISVGASMSQNVSRYDGSLRCTWYELFQIRQL